MKLVKNENELNKEKTVEYVASSLLTNTIVLKVNDNTFSKSKIENAFNNYLVKILKEINKDEINYVIL